MRAYFPFLNGLRCAAILWVLMNHILLLMVYTPATEKLSLLKKFCMAGHWGVDLFFVISGFLITGLLMPKEGSNDLPDILRFYIRRFFKIVPSYYFLLIFVLSFSLFHYSDNPYQKLIIVNNIPYYFFFTHNLFQVHLLFLDHLWSIAVEEHFYLVYPLLILLIGSFNKGRFSKNGVMALLIFVFFLVNFLRYLNADKATDQFTQNTIYRLDGLSLGCMIKILQERILNFKFRKIGGYCALVLSLGLWSLLIYYGANLTWYFPALAAIASAALIIACLMEAQPLIPILEIDSFQFIGRISYNLYLWHYPMIFLSFIFLSKFPYLIIPGYVVSVILVGWLMTDTLEKYFLKLRDKIIK